jgi:hypothetical protein
MGFATFSSSIVWIPTMLHIYAFAVPGWQCSLRLCFVLVWKDMLCSLLTKVQPRKSIARFWHGLVFVQRQKKRVKDLLWTITRSTWYLTRYALRMHAYVGREAVSSCWQPLWTAMLNCKPVVTLNNYLHFKKNQSYYLQVPSKHSWSIH